MKKRIPMSVWGAVLVLFTAAAGECAQGDNAARQIFDKGNTLYTQGRYQDAAKEYEAILSQGLESASVYFNLGNCYAKQGLWAKALLQYERSRMLDPSRKDLKTNYEFVRSALFANGADIRQSRFWVRWFDGIVDDLSGMSVSILAIIVSVVFLALLGAWLYGGRRKGIVLAIAVIFFLAWLLLCMAQFRKARYFGSGAVVIAAHAQVYFEPREQATVYFLLPQGSVVEILEISQGWYKIKRQDDLVGWVQNSMVERIGEQ